MARVPFLQFANIIIWLLIEYLRLVSADSPQNIPQFANLTIIRNTTDEDSSATRILFKVRGNMVFKGLEIKATKNKAEAKTFCTDELLNYTLVELEQSLGAGLYEISVPNGVAGVLYFCVSDSVEYPKSTTELNLFTGPHWYHQGPNISLSIGSDSARQE